MKCPIDTTELQMTERQGVEIDYCPKCRGVWLDRGELDKIIEKSDRPAQPQSSGRFSGDQDYDDDHNTQGRNGYGKRRRGGMLGELFDF